VCRSGRAPLAFLPAHFQDLQIACCDGPVGLVFLCDVAGVLMEGREIPAYEQGKDSVAAVLDKAQFYGVVKLAAEALFLFQIIV
jgi:hypothetical protein